MHRAAPSPDLLSDTDVVVGPDPRELGRHLREVRRRQGLSRADVARSAGLSRRELAAYERGRVEIPQSDLWCLAGSCGVEPSELLSRPSDAGGDVTEPELTTSALDARAGDVAARYAVAIRSEPAPDVDRFFSLSEDGRPPIVPEREAWSAAGAGTADPLAPIAWRAT